MNSDLEGRPVKVEPPNPLMEKLDSFEWQSGEVMPEGRWKVWSGIATADFIANANREAAQMTGEAKGPFSEVDEHAGEQRSRVILALLDKELQFTRKLHPSASAPLAFRGGDAKELPVRFFGVKGGFSAGFGKVIRILHRDKESHALRIEAGGAESLVLYLPARSESFDAACKKLRDWRKEGLRGEFGSPLDPGLHANDDLRIPYIDLGATADFKPSLSGLRFHRGHQDPWVIVKAEQQVKFTMTEKGAKVRAKVELAVDPFGEVPPPPPMTPRKFYFDRPFYAFMWRDDAEWPYFGAWIGDASVMETWK